MRLRLLRSGHALDPSLGAGELLIAQRRPYNSFLALVNTYVGGRRPHRRHA